MNKIVKSIALIGGLLVFSMSVSACGKENNTYLSESSNAYEKVTETEETEGEANNFVEDSADNSMEIESDLADIDDPNENQEATEASTLVEGATGEAAEVSLDDGQNETDATVENTAENATETTTEEANKNENQKNHSNKKSSNKLATPSKCGSLQVIGTQLCDKNGKAVQLRGISTHGLAWFPEYVNDSLFAQLRDEWNVNVMRLAMYTHEYGGYSSGGNQGDLKKLVKNGVKYATDNDMYVIVDWHVLNEQDPNTYIDDAKDFFKEMSKEFAGQNNVIYEICNEPNGSTTWSDIKEYAGEIIPIIRKNDEKAIIIVGTPNWSQQVDKAADDPITGYDNIMYALHFYAATHKDWLRNTMTGAIDKGLPVFVTEYGICDASGSGGIDETEANSWVRTMDQYGVSYVAWNLSNKDETSAIIKSSCSKKSGILESDLSASGKWLYDMLSNATEKSALQKDSTKDDDMQKDSSNSADEASNQTLTNESEDIKERTTSSEEATSQNAISQKNGDLQITANLVNSWESEGGSCYQYSIVIKNTSEKEINNWKIKLKFNNKIGLQSAWNGQMEVSKKTLTIQSLDYNGTIPAGGEISDIGCIISGSSSLKMEE